MNKNFISAGSNACSFEKHIPAPYIRKSFILSFKAECATLEICGMGVL